MRYLLSILLVIFSLGAVAQQTPVTNFYNQNLYGINPGYAGLNGCIEGYMGYRLQWLGMPGAPITYGLQVHTSIKEKMGAGASVSQDKLGGQSMLKANGSYAYEIKLNQVNKIRFGVAGGIIQHTMTTAGTIVEDVGDPLASGGYAGMSYGGHAGAVFHNDKFLAGVVLPHIYYSRTPGISAGYKWSQHVTLHGSYWFDTSGDLSINPSLLLRILPASVIQADAAIQARYKKFLMFGLSYRNGAGFSAMAGIRNYKNFTLGYAYEIPFLGSQRYSTGSHEIILGYRYCKNSGGPDKDTFRPRDKY